MSCSSSSCQRPQHDRQTNHNTQAAAATAATTATTTNAPPAPRVARRRLLAVRAQAEQPQGAPPPPTRRALLAAASAVAAALALAPARATSLPDDNKPPPSLCDAACGAELDKDPSARTTTPSGLQYRDIVVGTGPQPVIGFQVVCDYIAMTPKGKVFANSLEKGTPYDVRVGSGQIIPGLNEGLLSMRVGGVRRLYIPGDLAFPKGLKAAAGRPSVPAASPVVFDVALRYIPGLEDDE